MKIGIDIVSIDRIRKIYERYGDRFLHKVLNPSELSLVLKIKNRDRKIEKIAGIFSAKEAVIKCFEGKVSFREVEIRYENSGLPVAHVGERKLLISISHEKNFAVALAVFQ